MVYQATQVGTRKSKKALEKVLVKTNLGSGIMCQDPSLRYVALKNHAYIFI